MNYRDQIGHTIHLNNTPCRIISLVPSQSEYLWHLGLKEKIVGITKFCIKPNELYQTKPKLGGTKQLNIEKIRALKPDLIIGNKEENDETQIKLLQKEFNVWMSDIYSISDAYEMMLQLGLILNKEKESQQLVSEIQNSFDKAKNLFKGYKVAYFIWNNPMMLAAKHTFIDSVLNEIGLVNVLSHLQRYPQLSVEEIKKLHAQLLFLSSEPFPFKEQHVQDYKLLFPQSKVMLVDGEMFSWYGSRLLYLENYLRDLKKQLEN